MHQDNFISSTGSMSVTNYINPSYDEFNQNIQIKKIKAFFKVKIKEIAQNNNNLIGSSYSGIGPKFLCNWIEKLEEKLSQKLGKIKKDHSNLFMDNQIANNFTNIAIELENFIYNQAKEIKGYIEGQFEENNSSEGKNDLKQILSLYKDFFISILEIKSNIDPDQIFENQLFLKSTKVISLVYEYYTTNFEKMNEKFIDKINEKYKVYNIKLEK